MWWVAAKDDASFCAGIYHSMQRLLTGIFRKHSVERLFGKWEACNIVVELRSSNLTISRTSGLASQVCTNPESPLKEISARGIRRQKMAFGV